MPVGRSTVYRDYQGSGGVATAVVPFRCDCFVTDACDCAARICVRVAKRRVLVVPHHRPLAPPGHVPRVLDFRRSSPYLYHTPLPHRGKGSHALYGWAGPTVPRR